MAELKTRPTRKSARKYIRELEHPRRREDARVLLDRFWKGTGRQPVMWGESIVGFGRYHYRQRSGQKAGWPGTGVSPRKQNLVIYVMPGFDNYQDLLLQLGKYKTARSCLYINKLADIDLAVLRQLVEASIQDMTRIYRCD